MSAVGDDPKSKSLWAKRAILIRRHHQESAESFRRDSKIFDFAVLHREGNANKTDPHMHHPNLVTMHSIRSYMYFVERNRDGCCAKNHQHLCRLILLVDWQKRVYVAFLVEAG